MDSVGRIQELNQLEEQEAIDASPYFLFSYSIRSPHTKETYFRRLRLFFDSISVDGNTFEDRSDNQFILNFRSSTPLILNLNYADHIVISHG